MSLTPPTKEPNPSKATKALGEVDGWYHIAAHKPPKRYEVHWVQKTKKGPRNMKTLAVPEVLVQVEGSYDSNTGKAAMIIAEWLHGEGRWAWDGALVWKQEELIWWRHLPEAKKG